MRKLLRLLPLLLTFTFFSSIALKAQNDYNKTDSQAHRQREIEAHSSPNDHRN